MYYEMGLSKNANPSQSNSFEYTPGNLYNDNIPNRVSVENNTNMGAIRVSVISRKKNVQHNNTFKDSDNERKEFDTSSLLFKEINMIQIKENNGFEATYNNFKSVLFFVFDNIFENDRWCRRQHFFSEYFEQIMGNFEESILK